MSVSNKSTPTKTLQNNFVNLADIAANPEKSKTVIGVILDATGSYKTDDSYDYVSKLKIIDPSYNPRKKSNLKLRPYIMVFIFTPKLKDTPIIRRVGDIVFLKNFYFDNYEGMVKGIYKKSRSEWQILDCRSDDIKPCIVSKEYSTDLKHYKDKIMQLRKWSRGFFKSYSLYDLSWFDLKIPEIKARKSKKTIHSLKDMDLIVKVLGSIHFIVDGASYYRIVFVDKKQNKYFAELKNLSTDIQDGSVVKLRSVVLYITDKSYKISFFNYSDILELQGYFKDYIDVTKATKSIKYEKSTLENTFLEEYHLEKSTKTKLTYNTYMFVPPNNNISLQPSQIVKKFRILEHFDIDPLLGNLNRPKMTSKSKIGSLIMKTHSKLVYTPIKKLNSILDKVTKNSKSFKNYKHKTFRVQARLVSMKSTDIKEVIKFYSKSISKTMNLKDFKSKRSSLNDLQVIFYNIFTFEDSQPKHKNSLKVYLITIDQNPQFIFDLWNVLPDTKDLNLYKNLKKSIANEFEQNLERMVKDKRNYDLVLQLSKNKNDTFYYRIIDTIFTFR